jgi:hypothetical protein
MMAGIEPRHHSQQIKRALAPGAWSDFRILFQLLREPLEQKLQLRRVDLFAFTTIELSGQELGAAPSTVVPALLVRTRLLLPY